MIKGDFSCRALPFSGLPPISATIPQADHVAALL